MNYHETHCFTCGKIFKEGYFSYEWDAFICTKCYEKIMSGDFKKNTEEETIYEEFKEKKVRDEE